MKNQKTNTIIFLGLAFCFLIIGACRLDQTNPGLVTLKYNSLEEFFELKGVKTQNFEKDGTNNIVVVGNKGTKVEIAASDIIDSNGQNPTGNIKVKLREIYTKSEMVISNMPTSSQGEVLESGGEIYIELTKTDGSLLSLKNGAEAVIALPVSNAIANPNTMKTFFGIEDVGLNWIPGPDNTVSFDSIAQTFDLLSNRLGWINCDYFYNSPDPKTIIKLSPTISSGRLTDVEAFIVFSDINSVMGMNYSNANKEFSKANIPTNHQVSIVVIGIDLETFYFAKKDVNITDNLNLTINLDEISESDLINSLNTLN